MNSQDIHNIRIGDTVLGAFGELDELQVVGKEGSRVWLDYSGVHAPCDLVAGGPELRGTIGLAARQMTPTSECAEVVPVSESGGPLHTRGML
jgi:hypothetical protein